MAKRKAPCTPSRKQFWRRRDPRTGRFLPSEVTESSSGATTSNPHPTAQGAGNSATQSSTHPTAQGAGNGATHSSSHPTAQGSGSGATHSSPHPTAQGTEGSDNTVDSPRTQLTPLEHTQRAGPAQTPEREDSPIKDTPSPEPEVDPQQGALIWNLITPGRSFWDAVRQSAQHQNSSTQSGEDDIDAIMRNVTNSVNYHIQNRGIENQGYLSSSPRAPCRDGRAMVPVNARDEQEQQLMMWPTVQQAV
ncbi:MAG: hypothetical protein Q9183_007691, partial [Haloplaca sp. 2 TL-2023]